jgi:hypothetical protein
MVYVKVAQVNRSFLEVTITRDALRKLIKL